MTMSTADMQNDSTTAPAGTTTVGDHGGRIARASGPRADQPKRRTFTAEYKLKMIEEYDAATEPGAKGDVRPAGAGGGHRAGVRADRERPGYAVPPPSSETSPDRRPAQAGAGGAAERADGARAGAAAGGPGQRTVRRQVTAAGVGGADRRGRVPGVGLHDVPGAAGGRPGPCPSRAGPAPADQEAGTDRPPAD